MAKVNKLQILGVVATVLGMVLPVLDSYINKKEMEEQIDEAVKKALEKNEES